MSSIFLKQNICVPHKEQINLIDFTLFARMEFLQTINYQQNLLTRQHVVPVLKVDMDYGNGQYSNLHPLHFCPNPQFQNSEVLLFAA